MAGVALLGGFVQGLSGFGFSLAAMSIWAWTLEPTLAAVLSVSGGLTGQIFAAFRVRRGFNWPRLWPFVAGGLLGLPFGLWLLPLLDPTWFKFFIGSLLAIWCPLMLASRHIPHVHHGGRVADGLSGVLGGIGGALGGFTGAIPTLWCTLRGYARDEQRSVVQNFNLALLAVTWVSYLATGLITRAMIVPMLVMAPVIVLSSLFGTRVYLGISDQAFRNLVLGLLTASGLAMLGSAVPALWLRAAAL